MSQLGFLVTTSRGLDELLKDEIASLCPEASVKQSPGLLRVDGSLEDAYRVCLWSRLANRVIWVLNEGDASSAEAMYETASKSIGRCSFLPKKLSAFSFTVAAELSTIPSLAH